MYCLESRKGLLGIDFQPTDGNHDELAKTSLVSIARNNAPKTIEAKKTAVLLRWVFMMSCVSAAILALVAVLSSPLWINYLLAPIKTTPSFERCP